MLILHLSNPSRATENTAITLQILKFSFQIMLNEIKQTKIQPREFKLRTKANAQAHKSSSEFEITNLL